MQKLLPNCMVHAESYVRCWKLLGSFCITGNVSIIRMCLTKQTLTTVEKMCNFIRFP